MKKRFKPVIAMLLVMSMLLVGCGKNDTKSTDTTKKDTTESTETTATETAEVVETEKEPVTIEFWTISLQPTFTDFFNKIIDNYEAENTNVTINWIDLPYEAIQQKLIASTAGGTSPDVVNLNTKMALTLAGKDALVDLNAEATEEQRSIYIETLYHSATIGDSAYAFPWYGSPNIMMYNKDLLAKAGITELPTTYEGSFDMARTMMEKTGAYLFVPDEFFYQLMLNGFDILSTDKTTAAFNNENTLNLVSTYKDAAEEGIIPLKKWGVWDEQLKLFETGKLAIINSTGSSLTRIADEAPDIYKTIGIAEPITGSTGVTRNALMNLVVPTASKNHEEAIKFAAYITNDANQLAFCKEVAIFPSTKAASQDAYFTSDTTTLEGVARAMVAKVGAMSEDFAIGVEQEDNIQIAINKIYEGCITGDKDIAKAISEAEETVNKSLSEK